VRRFSIHVDDLTTSSAVYGRVGRFASEEVVIKLVSSKCLPVPLYGTEACPLFKSDLQSLDFVINRFFMKLSKTNNILIINESRELLESTCQVV
jgi:hypothetical protein